MEISYQQKLIALSDELKTSQCRLQQWQQLCVLEQAGQFSQQAQLLNWLLKQNVLDKTALKPEKVWFPHWLAEQVAAWQQETELADVPFILVEDPVLSLSELEFCTQHTAELLKQIISLIQQDLQQQELSLHINLQAFSDNKLLLQFDHAGQSKAIQQVLTPTEQGAGVLQQLCSRLLARLGAKLSVSALEDLGCSVRLELPLTPLSVKNFPIF